MHETQAPIGNLGSKPAPVAVPRNLEESYQGARAVPQGQMEVSS
jgi:hypothetical protein